MGVSRLNRAGKSRSFLTLNYEEKLIFKITQLEEYFPSSSIWNQFTFDFHFHQYQFSTINFTLARLRYTSDKKKPTFETQILHTAKFSLHLPISLLSVENWKLWQGLLTVCVSLCAIRQHPHIVILRWFFKSILLTFSFELLSCYKHNLSHNAWNRFDQQLPENIDMNSTQSHRTSRFRFSIK